MNVLRQDLRYAARLFARNPAYTVAAVLTLAIGIGGVTAIFSVVNGVMLRPLPYGDPERLVDVRVRREGPPPPVGSRIPAEADWPSRQRVFEDILEYRSTTTMIEGLGEPELQYVPFVPVDFLDFLDVHPWLGRSFVAEDATDPPSVALMSYGFWMERFGGNANALGTEIRTNHGIISVVGIMPPGFTFQPIGEDPADFWIPALPRGPAGFATVARLRPGVRVEDAQAELAGIVRALEAEYPGSGTRTAQVAGLLDATVGADWGAVLMLFFGAVGFVLLIAVANTANLTLARGVGREREIAIRSAIGSTRTRLVRQLLAESVFLSFVGGALGVVLAFWTTRLIVAALPPGFPRIQDIGIDGTVLAFTMAIVLLTGIAFGIGPALSLSSIRPDAALREAGRSASDSGWRHRFRSALVAGEVALATILLIGGLLLGRSLVELMGTPLGIDIDNVVSATMIFPAYRYDSNTYQAFLEELAERLRARPDVVAASLSTVRGMGFGGQRNLGFNEDEPFSRDDWIHFIQGDAHIFPVLGIALTSGRRFRDDEENAVVVTESLAERYFPGQDPLGRRIGVEGEWTIVGVARDFRHSGPASEPVPTAIAPGFLWSVLVKFRGDPSVLMNDIRSEVRTRDPDLVLEMVTLGDSLYALEQVSQPRFRTAILSGFAGVALVLSLVGISSVTAFSAARRSHELGIRIALGGTRARIRSTMLAQAMRPVIAGLVIGIAGAFALTRLISSYLYEVSPADPTVFTAAALLLLLAATVATWIPLHRSTTIEPMEALRYE